MKSSSAVLIASALVYSVNASAGPANENTDARTYHYGMDLDIAEVLSTDIPNSTRCKVVEAKMTYRDSEGAVEILRYRTLSSACIYN
ncbi:DUF2790 domain-containing protein [Stutzerimonas urumqiensis]|uniref:DUF2790 domain-containing protein n=1 Tax=Stutzerimonas urumqiensis TaxID=638269 RepID=UPI003BA85740